VPLHPKVDAVRFEAVSSIYGSKPVQLYYHVLPDTSRSFVLVGNDHGGLDRTSYMSHVGEPCDKWCVDLE
jgi:hypothetical protein